MAVRRGLVRLATRLSWLVRSISGGRESFTPEVHGALATRAYEATFMAGQPALAPMRFSALNFCGQPWEPQQAEYDGGTTLTLWHHDLYYGNRVGARFSFADQYMGLVGQPSRE